MPNNYLEIGKLFHVRSLGNRQQKFCPIWVGYLIPVTLLSFNDYIHKKEITYLQNIRSLL